MPQRRPRARQGIDTAPLFAALGDATRLSLVGRLCREGPASTGRLTEGTRVSRQAVSKHLAALESAGLVEGRRIGRERIWEIRPARLQEARHWLDQIAAQWDGALQRLAAHLDEPEPPRGGPG